MRDEEVQIINFLQCSPDSWFARKEIARRAVKRKEFEENPHWADTSLADLVARGVIENDLQGRYRLKKDELLK